MLAILKRSAVALFATVALPPYSHEGVTPSAPSVASADAIAVTMPPDRSRQANAPSVEPIVQVRGVAADRQRNLPETSQSSVPERRAIERSTPARISPVMLPLEIGDNLKIGFYETIDVGSNAQGGPDGVEAQVALRTFYQRMDLSGDYTVEQDGALSIPLLGRFQVEGRPLDEVRAELAASFTTVIGRSANVDARIIDRSPVYVVGPVKSPGAYKYVPGMIALQAIALAGGLDQERENSPGIIEGAREMERLRIATLQVEQLLAQRTRLQAERDGASSLSTPDDLASTSIPDEGATSPTPVQFAKADREKTAPTFLATESTILRAERARRRQQEQGIALRVATARSELDALKRKLDQFDVEKDLRVERLDAMQKLKDRGVVTANNVLILRTELADIEARRQDSLVASVETETRLAEAKADGAKLSSENTLNLTKEIATVDKELAAAREEAMSARMLATMLYRPSSRQAEAYEIMRRSKDGAKSHQATETSPLMPGDVLKITSNNTAASVAPNSVAPESQSSFTRPSARTAEEN